MNCTMCGKSGATIGCTHHNCFRVYHFSCSEDTGWRFDRDSKVFYCDLHRKASSFSKTENDRISLKFFLTKNPSTSLFCSFCHSEDDGATLLAYQQRTRQICAHEKCIKYTTIIDTSEIESSRMGHEYRNVFQALQISKRCMKCSLPGATVVCTDPSCRYTLHVNCCQESGWNFEKQGKAYLCQMHRGDKKVNSTANNTNKTSPGNTAVQHNLLSLFGATKNRVNIPSNLGMGGSIAPVVTTEVTKESGDDNSESSISIDSSEEDTSSELLDATLSSDLAGNNCNVRVERASETEKWNLSLAVEKIGQSNCLVVALSKSSGLQKDDVILSINGAKVGSVQLKTLRDVLSGLQKELVLMIEVLRK